MAEIKDYGQGEFLLESGRKGVIQGKLNQWKHDYLMEILCVRISNDDCIEVLLWRKQK